MWHKPCRTFHPWCPCIKTRCLYDYATHHRWPSVYLLLSHPQPQFLQQTPFQHDWGIIWNIVLWAHRVSLVVSAHVPQNLIYRCFEVCPNDSFTTWVISTLIPVWISNYIHYKVWDEITYPFPNVNAYTPKFGNGSVILFHILLGT